MVPLRTRNRGHPPSQRRITRITRITRINLITRWTTAPISDGAT